MPTYNGPDFARNMSPIGHGLGDNVKAAVFTTVTFAAAPTTADPINFGYVPANFVLLGAVLRATDMDTGGSPTLTLNIGDAGDADRIFAASTVAQTGTASNAVAATAIGYKYTTKTAITGVANANPATGAAGTLDLTLFGYIADPVTS